MDTEGERERERENIERALNSHGVGGVAGSFGAIHRGIHGVGQNVIECRVLIEPQRLFQRRNIALRRNAPLQITVEYGWLL